jgi:hypothetical protein
LALLTSAQRHALGVRQFRRRVTCSPKRRLGVTEIRGRVSRTKLKKEDLMKYLLLIATLAAFIGTTPATSLAADCCRGNAKCCPGECCKK